MVRLSGLQCHDEKWLEGNVIYIRFILCEVAFSGIVLSVLQWYDVEWLSGHAVFIRFILGKVAFSCMIGSGLQQHYV
jgi:hypothetical protein